MQAKELKASFTKRYVIAISLIALLATGAFYFLHLALETNALTALIVNMSGKQRMLSQRIASLSQQYYFCNDYNSKSIRQEDIRADLLMAIEEMARANNALSSGKLKDGVEVKLSPQIREIYYGKIDLKKRVELYLERAKRLSQEASKAEAGNILREIISLLLPLCLKI